MNKNFLCALFALSLLADSCFAAAKLVRDMKAAMSVADAERLLLQAKNMFADASGKDRTILHKLITTEGPAKIKSLEASAEQAEEDQKHAAELADLEVKIAAAAGGRGFDPAVAVIGVGSTDEEIEAKALYETMEAEKAAAAAGRKFDFDKELAKENRALVAQKEAAARGPARDAVAARVDLDALVGGAHFTPPATPFNTNWMLAEIQRVAQLGKKAAGRPRKQFAAFNDVQLELLAKNAFYSAMLDKITRGALPSKTSMKKELEQMRVAVQKAFVQAQSHKNTGDTGADIARMNRERNQRKREKAAAEAAKAAAEADAAANQANVATWVNNMNQYFAPMGRGQTLQDVYTAIGNPLAAAYAAAGCQPVRAGRPKLVDVATALNDQLGADLSTKVMGLRTLVGTQGNVNASLSADVDGVFTAMGQAQQVLNNAAQPTGCANLSMAAVLPAIQAIQAPQAQLNRITAAPGNLKVRLDALQAELATTCNHINQNAVGYAGANFLAVLQQTNDCLDSVTRAIGGTQLPQGVVANLKNKAEAIFAGAAAVPVAAVDPRVQQYDDAEVAMAAALAVNLGVVPVHAASMADKIAALSAALVAADQKIADATRVTIPRHPTKITVNSLNAAEAKTYANALRAALQLAGNPPQA